MMTTIDLAQQIEIVYTARTRMLEQLPEQPQVGGCLYSSFFLWKELEEAGIEACPQAGSMSWPVITPGSEHDDGKCDTHFSYIWSPGEPSSCISVLLGCLPEMHVWMGIPKTGEVVDIETCNFPKACHLTTDLKWLAPPAPDFLWTDDPPLDVWYRPDQAAIVAALISMRYIIERHDLEPPRSPIFGSL